MALIFLCFENEIQLKYVIFHYLTVYKKQPEFQQSQARSIQKQSHLLLHLYSSLRFCVRFPLILKDICMILTKWIHIYKIIYGNIVFVFFNNVSQRKSKVNVCINKNVILGIFCSFNYTLKDLCNTLSLLCYLTQKFN